LMPLSEMAHAQFAVNCTRSLIYDTLASCGLKGTVTITPATGNVSVKGCIPVLGTALAGRCTVKSFATSGSLKVQALTKKTNLTGAGTMEISDFNIATAGAGRTKTWTSGQLTATPLVFDVGGKLKVGAPQANGVYSGKIMMRATFTP